MTSVLLSHPRAREAVRAVRFWTVGASGIVVNQVVLVALLAATGLHYLVVATVATQVAIVWNFALTERWALAGRADGGRVTRRLGQFWLVNTAALAVHGPLMVALVAVLGVSAAASNLIALGVLAVARFAVADRLIWTARPTPAPLPAEVLP